MKFKLTLLQFKCNILEFTKREAPKDNQNFAEAFICHDRHTLFALEESGPQEESGPSRMTYTCESQ
jgi:hypothetical protein